MIFSGLRGQGEMVSSDLGGLAIKVKVNATRMDLLTLRKGPTLSSLGQDGAIGVKDNSDQIPAVSLTN